MNIGRNYPQTKGNGLRRQVGKLSQDLPQLTRWFAEIFENLMKQIGSIMIEKQRSEASR